jgi:hypothetical protein
MVTHTGNSCLAVVHIEYRSQNQKPEPLISVFQPIRFRSETSSISEYWDAIVRAFSPTEFQKLSVAEFTEDGALRLCTDLQLPPAPKPEYRDIGGIATAPDDPDPLNEVGAFARSRTP